MGITINDTLEFSVAHRTRLSPVEEVHQGSEKIITQNGLPAVTMIEAKRLDDHHQLDCEQEHLMLIDEVEKGLKDVVAGRASDAFEDLAKRRTRSKEKLAAVGI